MIKTLLKTIGRLQHSLQRIMRV